MNTNTEIVRGSARITRPTENTVRVEDVNDHSKWVDIDLGDDATQDNNTLLSLDGLVKLAIDLVQLDTP